MILSFAVLIFLWSRLIRIVYVDMIQKIKLFFKKKLCSSICLTIFILIMPRFKFAQNVIPLVKYSWEWYMRLKNLCYPHYTFLSKNMVCNMILFSPHPNTWNNISVSLMQTISIRKRVCFRKLDNEKKLRNYKHKSFG